MRRGRGTTATFIHILTQQEYWFSLVLSLYNPLACHEPAFSFSSQSHTSHPFFFTLTAPKRHFAGKASLITQTVTPGPGEPDPTSPRPRTLGLFSPGRSCTGNGERVEMRKPVQRSITLQNTPYTQVPKQLANKDPNHFWPHSFLSPDNSPAILYYILFLNSLGVWWLGADPICNCPIIHSCNLHLLHAVCIILIFISLSGCS